jgi:hypothetical protein
MRGASWIAAAFAGGALLAHASPPADPLAAEVERWSASLREDRSTDDFSKQVKEGATAGMVRIEQAMKDGQRQLALLRMSSVASDVAALRYLKERPAEQRQDMSSFEAEWKRMGGVLA